MIHYCDRCWAERASEDAPCPACGAVPDQREDLIAKYIAALWHPEPTRAALAVRVLGVMLREPRAVQPLIELLDSDQDIYVVRDAVDALGLLADRRALAPLKRKAMTDGVPMPVRYAAVDALAAIGGADAERALCIVAQQAPTLLRRRALRALAGVSVLQGEADD
ncbi:MAG: HEAT repeat domain-containing protein [Anaerolineae bacterium]